MRGAADLRDLPAEGPAEVSFAGRSNVGKSSLLNALVGRDLARASATPGRTQEINFFDVGGVIRLVDLPGYGFARAPKKNAKAWSRLTEDFLKSRATLRRVFLLIDARHGLKDSDEALMALLDAAGVSYQLVLTKADKTRPTELAALAEATARAIAKRPAAHPLVRATSAESGAGVPELRAEIALLAGGR
jgi:GTP-binding protein